MKLHVQLLEARNLRPPDRPCHAYVRLKLGTTKCKSSISQIPEPCWFEDFIFNVDDLGSQLHISVWHEDRFSDLFLGRLHLPVSVVVNANGMAIPSSWYPLQRRAIKLPKSPPLGEIRVGFALFGKTSICPAILPTYQSSSFSNSSSINSTPDHSFLSRTDSSDSCQSVDMSNSSDHTSNCLNDNCDSQGRDSDRVSFSSSFIKRVSTWLPNSKLSGPSKSERGDSNTELQINSEDSSSMADEDERLVPPSFFDDSGVCIPLRKEDLPAPLGGGILLAQTYAVSSKTLNGILFKPGSQFQKDFAEVQNTTQLVEGPWLKGDGDLPKRVVTYTKAATKLVKSVKATEDQTYSRADDKGFVVAVSAKTPDVPYGKTFTTDIQYCIFSCSDLDTGEKSSYLRISWTLNFISSTMMKGMIESGARQGLQESYKQFSEVLEKYAKPVEGNSYDKDGKETQRDNLDSASQRTYWEMAKQYICTLRICLALACTLATIMHVYTKTKCLKKGVKCPQLELLESSFKWLDLPDSVAELIIPALLGIEIQRMIGATRKFLGARLCKGSDHGVKAKGNGWVLTVTLIEAQNVPTSTEAGLPDPYIVFTCGGKSRTSSIKLQTSNPVWEETFEFDATEEAPSTMNVEIFDFEGPFTESESLGDVEINFLKQTQDDLADLLVPLEGKKARVSGCKVHLRVVLENTEETNTAVHYIEKVEKEAGTKITKRSLVKNTSFQKLFSLPSEEFLVNDFSCSLKRKFLIQGRLFLSPRVLAFYSNIFGHKTKFIILWEDIEDIKERSPALGSVSMLLNPTILLFTKKGRAMDAQHGAKTVDSKGRFKFQFQSFIHYKPAIRTMMTLWKYRTLSPEKRMEMIADIDQPDDASEDANGQTDEPETFLGVDEANLREVHSSELPVSVSSMLTIYEKENLDEKVAEKTGRLNYCSTPWESVSEDDVVHQRRVSFRLSNQISLFGTSVTCVQQKTVKDGHTFYLDEMLKLHDVPFGDNFQIRTRIEAVDVSSNPSAISCRVLVGVEWQKSTIFQNQISRNIFERYTRHLKDTINICVKEILGHRNERSSATGSMSGTALLQ